MMAPAETPTYQQNLDRAVWVTEGLMLQRRTGLRLADQTPIGDGGRSEAPSSANTAVGVSADVCTKDVCTKNAGQAFSFTMRPFFTDLTPGTCQAVQDAWALVIKSGTSPVSETTPALV